MACPFFFPTEPFDGGEWPHPARLPLGRGWAGVCSAGGSDVHPTGEELSKHCNLGYARCARLPQARSADAVRFCVVAVNQSAIVVDFVCERDHLPGEHGRLKFDSSGNCAAPHPDRRIQRMAECFAAVHLERKQSGAYGDRDRMLFDDPVAKS